MNQNLDTMEIKLHQKPQRSTGRTSLVLEYYYGYTRDEEGRIKHRRKFETLEKVKIREEKRWLRHGEMAEAIFFWLQNL